uniref:NAD(+) kinase n=1 Tax=Aplanochytrium stocchinoi TaxID=215587 RepID=A0A7S3UXX6_9STRA|mmetsp:Transcript_3538/g.4759  ORF Transcript_3538/g.4759 Transcript_3538/m.4759 type:complete len:372 (+) Transcript_3538:90-1205(+)
MTRLFKDGLLPKAVLVVSKGTRWEYLRTKLSRSIRLHQNSYSQEEIEKELEKNLINQSLPYERIKKSHDTHHTSLKKIVRGIKGSWKDCTVRVIRAHNLELADLERVDAVFTAGGDGTVLQTALWIHKNNIPVITINTDPVLSSGFLCSFQLKESTCFTSEILDLLQTGNFDWLMRARINLTMDDDYKDNHHHHLKIPRLALNEMFFAEDDPSRPTVHETSTGETGSLVQRSSGVIVSTGTGSTAWMSSASMVSKPDIARILTAAGLDLSFEELDNVTTRVNSDCVYSPSSKKLQYFVREPVMNGWYGRHDEPLSVSPRRGFTDLIRIKSLGWGETKLIVDGLRTFTVPYGSTVTARIAPEENWLRTVVFD